MLRRPRLLLGLLAVLIAVPTVVLALRGHGWELRAPDGGGVIAQVPLGQVASFGFQGVCVGGPTPATVESVRFGTADHLAVRRFAVRTIRWSKQDGLGSSDRSIVAEGFATSSRQVTLRCDRRDRDVTGELGIDVAATGPLARGRNLKIVYRLGNRRLTTEAQMDLVLCAYSAGRCPTS